MSGQVLFRNNLGSPLYATLFYTCPVPNKFSSLAMVAFQVGANMNASVQLPQQPFAFTWAKYNSKNKGIFTKDNQVPGSLRVNNVITFINQGVPHFINQTGAPIDEFNIQIDKSVRNNYFYGGLCLGNLPIYAQIMQPGDIQRYPSQMNVVFGYSLQPIVQGQVINAATLKTINLAQFQGAPQVLVDLDRDGQLHASLPVVAEQAVSEA